MKIAGIVATIALAVVVAFGAFGTGAWFTEEEAISNVQVQSGNLDLQVTWEPGPVATLEPGGGFVPVGWLYIKNAGNYNMKYRGYVQVTAYSELAPYVVMQGVINPDAGHRGSFGYYNDNPGDPLNPVTWQQDLSALQSWGSPSNPYFYVAEDCLGGSVPFAPGDDTWVRIYATLKESAPNAVEGMTLAATVHFEATQWINDGWTQ